MSKKKARQEETGLKAAADAAATKAAEVDPFEQKQRQYVTDLDDWRMGRKGPVDVRNMPGGGVGLALFADAKRSRDAGRVGRGLATLADGANPNFSAALDKEMQLERDTLSAGRLEGHVEDTLGNLDARMMGLSGVADGRGRYLADLAARRLDSYYQRPAPPPSFLKSLALGAVGAAGGMIKPFSI